LITIAFNYTFIGLWMSEYGERAGMKRYMSDYNPATHPDAIAVAAVVVEGENKPTN